MIENIGKHYLYRHIRLDTGEPFYIGIGTKAILHNTIKSEYSRAYSKSRRAVFWKKVVNKSGYEVEILLESDDYDFIKQKEIEFIALYGRVNLKTGILCNLTDGGEGTKGVVVSKETKKLLKESKLRGGFYEKEKLKYQKERLNTKHNMLQGYVAEVIEYEDSKNCTIIIDDGTILKNVNYNNLKTGRLSNPNHRTINGIGYIGVGTYNSTHKSYPVWAGVVRRLKKDNYVCEEWKCFQNFAEWYANKFKNEYMKGWRLDKDILVKDNKIYSPETCCLIPPNLVKIFKNSDKTKEKSSTGVKTRDSKNYTVVIRVDKISTYFTGFKTDEEAHEKYKSLKEQSFKDKAKLWKGKIEDRVYEALMNYKL